MLNIRRKSGMASLRYTMLAVWSLIIWMIGTTEAAVQTVDLWEEIIPSAWGYNTTYTQWINENGSFYLNNWSTTKNWLAFNYFYNYSSSHYPWFQFRWEYETWVALYQFAENRAWNSSIYTEFRVYPYISMVPNKQPTLNCSPTKPDNFTWNVCYYKDINELWEEYNWKFSWLYFENNRQLISCFIFEEMNEVFCPWNPVKNWNNTTVQWTWNAITFENFDESLVKYPIYIETPQQGGTTQITLGTCPTIQQLIDAYGTEYNESLCYSAKRLLTETWIVITTPQSIFELFPTYDEWKEWYNTYKNYCKGTSTEICRQAFSGEQAQWSIYNKAPTDTIGLYQYCHLQLEIEDKTQTTCVMSTWAIYATGVNEAIRKESLNKQSAIDIMIGSMVNLENVLPTSGSVLDALKNEWEERKIDRNFIDSIQELYNTFMTLFHYRNGVSGIIPDYITRIILIIVLFAVFKK